MVSTTGEHSAYYELNDALEPVSKPMPEALRPSVDLIAENCEPALCTVLFMGGAGGSLRSGVTRNPIHLTHSVHADKTRVTVGGAPVYIWPGGGITFMVDVTRLPPGAFGYVPTPALVEPLSEREIEVLALIVTHGHDIGVVEKNVGSHQHGIVEETGIGRLPARHGVLVSMAAFELSLREQAAQHPGELEDMRHVGLPVEQCSLGIQAAGKPGRSDVANVAAERLGVADRHDAAVEHVALVADAVLDVVLAQRQVDRGRAAGRPRLLGRCASPAPKVLSGQFLDQRFVVGIGGVFKILCRLDCRNAGLGVQVRTAQRFELCFQIFSDLG